MVRFLLAGFVLLPMNGPAAEPSQCGPLVQTFWTIDVGRRKLSYRERYRHPERSYCLKTSAAGMNAQADLLDEKKQLILSQPVFVPSARYRDTVSAKTGKLDGGVEPFKSVELSIHFPDGPLFRRGRYVRIVAPGVPALGPAALQ